ncbi:peptidase M23 [Salipaludibacillus neizhouensis]|uniref:Peptidase M23 n=1 Tax=Salipaludibacillus neizhouensis TaxID=885475 RepID=A0A3A9KLX6_9BACI|nr:M23 family metallopeptidase [Salipaludibacillus neizhouensis]RKL68865.1 peptidase M23 [Salipaludibacillus neizhouensis]
MKKCLITLFFVTTLVGCQNQEQPEEQTEIPDGASNQNNSNNEKNNEVPDLNQESNNVEQEKQEFKTHSIEGDEEVYLSVEEVTENLGGDYEYNSTDKSLTLEIEGREFYFVYEVPVMEVDGVYIPSDEITLKEIDGDPYVSKEFIEQGLETEYTYEEEEELLSFTWEDEVIDAWASTGQTEVDISSLSVSEMIEYLSFLQEPIENASVSTVESHLPGAPRIYRNGYHEGIDWYGYSTGTEITTDTPIRAMADGVVVRVDADFDDYPSHEIRNEDLDVAGEVGYTPEYILDRLRGKQVWVQYEDGVMSRFAHLDSIPEELELGQKVDEETVIGYVGNSGTSGAVDDDGSGLHLHQDLLIYGELFWEPYSLEEAHDILSQLFR